MTVKEENELKDKVKLYRIGVVILLFIIFMLAEAYFGALNKYNDLYDLMKNQQVVYMEELEDL